MFLAVSKCNIHGSSWSEEQWTFFVILNSLQPIMYTFSFLCSIRILSNVFYNPATKVSKFMESTRQHGTLISTAPYHCIRDSHKKLLDFPGKFYLFCINLCLFQRSALKLILPSQLTHVRTILTTNQSRPHIASF